MQRHIAYAICTYFWLSKISSEIQIFNFWVPIIWTLYTYVSKDMRIRGYFSKPMGVCEQTNLGKATLENHISFSVLHTTDFIKVSILL
jgi:hypothetical protein